MYFNKRGRERERGERERNTYGGGARRSKGRRWSWELAKSGQISKMKSYYKRYLIIFTINILLIDKWVKKRGRIREKEEEKGKSLS